VLSSNAKRLERASAQELEALLPLKELPLDAANVPPLAPLACQQLGASRLILSTDGGKYNESQTSPERERGAAYLKPEGRHSERERVQEQHARFELLVVALPLGDLARHTHVCDIQIECVRHQDRGDHGNEDAAVTKAEADEGDLARRNTSLVEC